MLINIAKDFSKTPGARYYTEGDFSGQEFREKLLRPKFLETQKSGEKLIINFDGGYGYPTSFLEEAFGGLVREFGSKEVLNGIELISEDEPSLVDEVITYIKEAKKEA